MTSNKKCSSTAKQSGTAKMKHVLVHGTLVPKIEDSFSPNASDMVGHMMMKGLECPFTWNSIVLNSEDTSVLEDELPISASPWDLIVKKCHLAYSEFCRGYRKKSSALISECFIPLLEVPGLQTTCKLIKKYRQALRHVLDATSAFICLADCKDYVARQKVYQFVISIPAVALMDESQTAAIHAIRSKYAIFPECLQHAQIAVDLDGSECLWRLYLSVTLCTADIALSHELSEENRLQFCAEVFKASIGNHSMVDQGPEYLLHQAHLLLAYGHDTKCGLAYECIQLTLAEYPNNPYVFVEAADILQRWPSSCSGEPEYFLLIEPLYKKALKLIGKECLSLRHKLGLHQVLHAFRNSKDSERLRKEGLQNLQLASCSLPQAEFHLQAALQGTLMTLGDCVPNMLCEHKHREPHAKPSKPPKNQKKKKTF